MQHFLLLFLRSLCTVLGASLKTTVHTLSIKCTSDDVVSCTRKVSYSSASNQNNAVFLKIVADARNVSCYLDTVCQSNSGNLSQCRVRLLRCSGSYCRANASLLRGTLVRCLFLQGVQALLKRGSRRLLDRCLSSCPNQLVKCRHTVLLPFLIIFGLRLF